MNLAVLLWGFTGVLGRAISLDAPMLVWYRMLFTALIMAAILTYRKQWVTVARGDLWRLLRVGCLMALHWVAFYGAIKFTNASIALVCLSTASVFTALLDPLVNKGRFDYLEILLGLLALSGVYVMYLFQDSATVKDMATEHSKFIYGVGILSGVIAALLSSVFTVLNKRLAHKYPARTMVFYEMATGWVFISCLIPIQFYYMPETKFFPRSENLLGSEWLHNDWLWLVALSLCCTVWAQSLALTALKKLTAFIATLSVNLEPLYGMLLAFVLYHENKDLGKGFFIGMSLILLSVVLQVLRMLRPNLSTGYVKQ